MPTSAAAAEASSSGAAANGAYARIPRVIWMLWFDGWQQATELHHRCVESWQLLNVDWEVRPIQRKDIQGLLGDFFPRYERLRHNMNALEKFGGLWIPPAAESDLLRLLLLGLYGGVWADSTMLCRRPLDEWLPDVASSGFFAFSPEDIEEQLPVQSSFLAAEPGHKLVAHWLRRTIEHWSLPTSQRTNHGFFWLHKLFGQLVGDPLSVSLGLRIDDEAKALWEKVPRVSGEYGKVGPHYWVKYTNTLVGPPTAEQRKVIEGDYEMPMWKLTNHEVKLRDMTRESCYWVLLEETRKRGQKQTRRANEGPREQLEVVRKLLGTGDRFGCH